MAILIKAIGFILSLLPLEVLELMTECLAKIFMFFPSSRRRVLLSNLMHAFQGWSYEKVKETALESAVKMFEMGIFSLIYPFMSKDQLKRTILFTNDTENELTKLRQAGKPVMFLTPHVCLFEAIATSPFFRPQKCCRLGAIYRPNQNKALDQWINRARLKVGINILSRKDSFYKTKEYLKKGNWVVVLFDQNAGQHGELTKFMGRLTSFTILPNLLVKNTDTQSIFAFPKRDSIFQSTLVLQKITSPLNLTLSAHEMLEQLILNSENGLPEWLWSHGKWKAPYHAKRMFNLAFKRNSLPPPNQSATGYQLWVRMPNWLGDLVMSLPLLRAIKESRPDMKITLLCLKKYEEILNLFFNDFKIETLPDSSISSFVKCWKLRRNLPGAQIVLTNSLRGDIESFLIGAPIRYGVLFNKKVRPLINYKAFPLKDSSRLIKSNGGNQQVEDWAQILFAHGFTGNMNWKPFNIGQSIVRRIGIIPGSANNHIKCWAKDNWINLLSKLLDAFSDIKITIFGAVQDSEIANYIKTAINDQRVVDLTGKTNLVEFSCELSKCIHVVGNDTGGIHLANAVGANVSVLYGPTNPTVTKPAFFAPVNILQPQGCLESGGISINKLKVDEVFRTVASQI